MIRNTPLRTYIFLVIAVATVFFSPATVRAQSENPVDDITVIEPTPRITIPGLSFTDAKQIQDEAKRNYEFSQKIILQIPYLAEYIAGVYKYIVGVASILTILIIIVAGFQWSMSGGSPDAIGEAKKRIGGAVTGLVIAVGSYALLYAINPGLVQFRSLSLQYTAGTLVVPAGEPENSEPLATPYRLGSLDENSCRTKLSALPSYAATHEVFKTSEGYCLRWTKRALEKACGSVPNSLEKNGAWDVAAYFTQQGKFRPCTLDGIQDGDIVFMTTMGSYWIGLFQNFRVGQNGCTVADARAKQDIDIKEKNGAKRTNVIPVETNPRGMPPVTHVGIYYQGKIYHRTSRVEDTDVTGGNLVQLTNQTHSASAWRGITVTGSFVKNRGIFISGYVSLSDL